MRFMSLSISVLSFSRQFVMIRIPAQTADFGAGYLAMKKTSSSSLIIKMPEDAPIFRHCQWITGEGKKKKFCRRPVQPGETWCSEHKEKVYAPAEVRERYWPSRMAVFPLIVLPFRVTMPPVL